MARRRGPPDLVRGRRRGLPRRSAREAGTRLDCALPSVLYGVAIVEDGEVSASAVAPDGSFSVTVDDDDDIEFEIELEFDANFAP